MLREEKQKIIESLTEQFKSAPYFYLADTSNLSVSEMNQLRRLCYQHGVTLRIAKNTLIRKSLESTGKSYDGLFDVLHGPTSIFFAQSASLPAKVIKEFRKTHEKPVLKAAYVEESIFIGDAVLEQLAALKTKQELIGEIVALLQSPIHRVVQALKSGGDRLAGILKALEERASS
ncbi:MAG: 50S ribosomal protein L10 [Chitinophagales bacterium]|nr:50S ribosomal protein L10 [Chitinophagales bacterium]MDW8427972.1 50S ribosomal protein L10 [Chitinophagales bacterium]